MCDSLCGGSQWGQLYAERTFDMVFRLRFDFLRFARQYCVPIIAIAGSVADEYDTQTGVKGTLDRLQNGFISALPSSWIWVDEQVGSRTKLLNATLHDLGIGNIKLETAKQFFPHMSWGDLVDYILTDQGTIHTAAMVIQQAVERLRPYVCGLSDAHEEAVYVSYYKQGDSYIQRYLQRSAAEPNTGSILPGEGCRVFRQRHRLVEALCGCCLP